MVKRESAWRKVLSLGLEAQPTPSKHIDRATAPAEGRSQDVREACSFGRSRGVMEQDYSFLLPKRITFPSMSFTPKSRAHDMSSNSWEM